MAEKVDTSNFNLPVGQLGHTLVIGPTGSGKTFLAALAKMANPMRPGTSDTTVQGRDDAQTKSP
ncbi:hypothetical protein BLA39750_01124 [Burkholderia lata]|uniref:Uncharacterized protein n=1 Tax=Burkholderia lata (strain ATCC 17760 / DSM 23089 / LMG 22485 / NCIMB 9086 / R18194 / 383) TaxID=482957 RepID=A0A6P2VI47_BURL3|nr:hypothetical protein [Burkholderia lata]VWC79990.1 hypothetical protein BLA39750_01124 [Burkholderia lata]